MQDIDLTPQDYKNPIKHRVKEVSFTASSDMYMDVHSYWKVINIETDEDILGFEGLSKIGLIPAQIMLLIYHK